MDTCAYFGVSLLYRILLFIMMCYFFNNKKVDSNISVFTDFKKSLKYWCMFL